MLPPKYILEVWKKFDRFPMETLSKLWYFHQDSSRKQRDVPLMEEHRQQYGVSGNCFDLAIWLLDAFQKEGIRAYPIGDALATEDAHAAVIALDEAGNRFLCDLGDQWIQPILVEAEHESFTAEKIQGFFPGAEVQVRANGSQVEILYHRPNGKMSKQNYDLGPVEMVEFLEAAEFSQNNIYPKPLVECRIPFHTETAHWEFFHWESFLSTNEGLYPDPKLDTDEEWARKISEVTGFNQTFVLNVLGQYRKL